MKFIIILLISTFTGHSSSQSSPKNVDKFNPSDPIEELLKNGREVEEFTQMHVKDNFGGAPSARISSSSSSSSRSSSSYSSSSSSPSECPSVCLLKVTYLEDKLTQLTNSYERLCKEMALMGKQVLFHENALSHISEYSHKKVNRNKYQTRNYNSAKTIPNPPPYEYTKHGESEGFLNKFNYEATPSPDRKLRNYDDLLTSSSSSKSYTKKQSSSLKYASSSSSFSKHSNRSRKLITSLFHDRRNHEHIYGHKDHVHSPNISPITPSDRSFEEFYDEEQDTEEYVNGLGVNKKIRRFNKVTNNGTHLIKVNEVRKWTNGVEEEPIINSEVRRLDDPGASLRIIKPHSRTRLLKMNRIENNGTHEITTKETRKQINGVFLDPIKTVSVRRLFHLNDQPQNDGYNFGPTERCFPIKSCSILPKHICNVGNKYESLSEEYKEWYRNLRNFGFNSRSMYEDRLKPQADQMDEESDLNKVKMWEEMEKSITADADGWNLATCSMVSNHQIPLILQEDVNGQVNLWQQKSGGPVRVHVQLQGFRKPRSPRSKRESILDPVALPPTGSNAPPPSSLSSLHGFTVHQYGDLSHGCSNTGPHYNPEGTLHGGPLSPIRHVGDLGNLKVDSEGKVDAEVTYPKISLIGKHSIIGRSLVVHAESDDLGRDADSETSPTSGNSGAKIACCKIESVQTLPKLPDSRSSLLALPDI